MVDEEQSGQLRLNVDDERKAKVTERGFGVKTTRGVKKRRQSA
jgi:hypothetical protein